MTTAVKKVKAKEVKARMNKKVKKLWVDALNSGKYKQICGYMRDVVPGAKDDTEIDMSRKSMCVMGVLAEVALEQSGLKYTSENYLKFASGNDYPSNKTMEWAGLTSKQVEKLIAANDGNKMTFEDFAEHIQKTL